MSAATWPTGVPDRFTAPEQDPDLGYRERARSRLWALVVFSPLLLLIMFAVVMVSRGALAETLGQTVDVPATVVKTEIVKHTGRRSTTYTKEVSITWEEGGAEHAGTYSTDTDAPEKRGDVIYIHAVPGSDVFSTLSSAAATWVSIAVVAGALLVLLLIFWMWKTWRRWVYLFQDVRDAPWFHVRLDEPAVARRTRRRIAPLRRATVQAYPGSRRPFASMNVAIAVRADQQVPPLHGPAYLWPTGRAILTKRPISPFLLQDATTGVYFVGNGAMPRGLFPPRS